MRLMKAYASALLCCLKFMWDCVQVSETVTGNVVRTIIDMLLKTFQYPRKKAELPLGVLAGSYSLFDMQLCKQSPEHADEPRPLERPSRKTSTSSMAQKEYFGRECIADATDVVVS